MATLAWYLRRFQRFVAPPGRPARIGIASTPSTGPSAELEDVLAAVDAIRREADGIRNDAAAEAARVRADAKDRADRVLEQARRRASAQRDEAAALHRAQIDDGIAAALAAADDEAAQISARTAEGVDAFAEQIVHGILRPDPGVPGPDGTASDGLVRETA
jgi:cell division septum initiation protein DivIVA